MRNLFISLFFISAMGASACTNFIVGKGASTDGSVICTYNADDYGMFQNLCHYPAAKHAPGEMRRIVDWDTNAYHGEIPEAPETYNVIGNINEYQVTIGETTYGGREEMVDPEGILDYGSLIYVTLQRSKTAREAISVMTTLVETYGYNSEGETFTICDPNEAWIMEMMGMGPGSHSAVWVAIRIPDNAISGHANQSRITTFDMKDKKNVLYSKNVVKYARKMGWFSGKDSEFSWNAAYAKPDFSGRRICEARVWSFFNHFSNDMNRYLPFVTGMGDYDEPMPLWIVPNRKLSVQDVEECMRDHFEGTPFALDGDIGGGIWEMPYRPTPLYFELDGKKYFNERPTSTQQTTFSYVSQMRSWLPREIGGVIWWGNDDGNMVAYTPIYCSMTERPECYNTPGADEITFSDKNAYWVCNWVSNMVYPRYSLLFPALKIVRDSLEQSYFAAQRGIEERAMALYQESPQKAVSFLNNYSVEKAKQMLKCWNDLARYMIVKYNDMIIKPEKDGQFTRDEHGLGTRPQRPGYPDRFKRALIKQTGTKFEVPEEK
ncbi:MAG: C69 family dipeptidase [Prevotella sp.]|nr:C69 family dipeptidase [Prevotella sp.]